MRGNNEIHMNQATMVEAMQLWLDHTFKNPPEALLPGDADLAKAARRNFEGQTKRRTT